MDNWMEVSADMIYSHRIGYFIHITVAAHSIHNKIALPNAFIYKSHEVLNFQVKPAKINQLKE